MSNTSVLTKSSVSAETITITAIFTAIVSIISAIPAGFQLFGVPATLQTFGMAFLGFALGSKTGTSATALYILAGLIGIPVFNGFESGPAVLFGITGGFLFGFLPLTALCGAGLKLSKKTAKRGWSITIALTFGCLGLFLCHLCGILQFAFVYHTTIPKSFLMVSLPYLPKDIVSIAVAYFSALAVRNALSKAKLLPKSAV